MHNIEKSLQMTYFWKNEYFIDRHVYFFVSKNIEKFVLLFQLLCDSAIFGRLLSFNNSFSNYYKSDYDVALNQIWFKWD